MARLTLVALKHFSAWKFASALLQSLGVLWLFVEAGGFVFPEFGAWAKTWWLGFVIAGVVVGCWRAWPRLVVSSRVSRTDVRVEIRVCDILNLPGAVVVPCNTTFDTSIAEGVISEESVQGQFTQRCMDGEAALDRQLEGALSGEEHETRSPAEKSYGKRRVYPVGTVALVEGNGRRGYLVAIASMNSRKAAEASLENIMDALPRLWEFVRTSSGMEAVLCPIVGSRFARVSASREELIREIIKSFVAATREGNLCEHLTIAIAPQDYRKGSIDLAALGGFLDHECRYATRGDHSQVSPRGTPVG